MKQSYRLQRTHAIMALLLCFLLGMGAVKLIDLSVNRSWLAIAIVFVLLSIKRKPIALICAVGFMGFVLGGLRGTVFLKQLEPYQSLYEQKIVFQGTSDNDGTYGKNSQLEFDATNVHILDPFEADLPGKIKVSGFGEPAIFRGDVVQIEGKLFTTLGSRQGRVSFAELQVIGRSASVIETLRRNFIAGMQSALPEPLASFGVGLLIGQKATLPQRTTDELGAVGLTHIIAVSGYNLTIIMHAVRRVLGKRSKYQVTILSLGLMVGFLLLSGFSASIVRAAIVSGLSLWAWYYGRNIKPMVIILLSAAITAAWNPLYLWGDIGWYLSFLAFFGVLIIAPALTHRLYRVNKQPKLLASVAIESLCAQIMTVPIILWIFQESSMVAPLSNIMIVPLVPLAMLLTLVAGLAGMLLPIISGWFAWPARILLTFMLDMVSIFASVPHALIKRTISVQIMLSLYAVFGAVTIILWRKTASKRATITDTELL